MRYSGILYELNPVAKIIMMLVLAVPVTFSSDVYYPLALLIAILGAGAFFSGLSPAALLKSLRTVAAAGLCLCVFLVLTRAVNRSGDLQIGIFGIRYADIRQAVSLALRMLGFACTALLFIRTTDPVLLVISLVQQWRVPYQAGYAFLVAYRFVPAFQTEFQKIRMAHEVRGVHSPRSRFGGIWSAPRYLIPLLVHAIRVGERVAIAMDARAFGLTPTRTCARTAAFGRLEKRALIICITALILLTAGMAAAGLFAFSIGFSASGIA